MLKVLIGILIGVLITRIVIRIENQLKKENRVINWRMVCSTLAAIGIVIWLIYSFIGMAVAPEYTKPNGNVCKGFKYGMQICSGDINAE